MRREHQNLTIALAAAVKPSELNEDSLRAIKSMSRNNFIAELLSHFMTLGCLFLALAFGSALMMFATVANFAFTNWLHRYHDYEEARYILRCADYCRGKIFA